MGEIHRIIQGDTEVIFNPDGQLKICAKNDKRVGSRGLWHGDNPLEFVLPATMAQIVLAVAASHLLYLLLRPLRTPRFVCCVLGGIVLGPSFLGHNDTFRNALYPPRQAEFLGTVSTFGASYFIFIVALKMDVATTLRAAKSTWKFGVIPFLTSLAVVSTLVYTYEEDSVPTITSSSVRTFFSAVMSFSNFIVLSDSLMELNLASSELGQIALSSAMINDTMQWFTLLLMSFLNTRDFTHSVQFLICYWLLIFFCIFCIRPLMIKIAKRTPVGKPVKEVYILCILSGVLIMAALADVIGLSFLQGPLLLGLVMPNGPPLGTTLTEKTQAVVVDFLMPLFFVFIGLNTNLYELKNWRAIMMLQWIILAGYAVKLLACMLVAVSFNMRIKHGLVLGLMLNLKGIVELMTFARMKRLQVLDEQGFCHLVFNLLVLTSIISPLIKVLYKPHARLDISNRNRGMMRTIQDTPRHTQFCIISCVYNEGNVHSNVALLEACNPNIGSPICTYVVHFIELLGKSTPFLLPVDDKQRRKSMSINYPNTSHILRAFENYAQNSDGRVIVRPYVNVAPYKQMHEAVCNLAIDKNIPFLIIAFHENGQPRISHMTTSIRDVNSNFQQFAPCTVGILVDRCSQLSMSGIQLSFHVGIFFIGGPDDREALSLGLRMTEERKNTKVSLFSFVLKNKNLQGKNKDEVFGYREGEDEAEMESFLDESFLDEFKAMNIGNDNFVFEEIKVDDGIGVLEAIRKLEGSYDLVMVGRRHRMVNVNDEEMSIMMENVEILGMFGDMLASTEFCGGMVPVLVTQCGGKRYGRFLNRVGSAQLRMTPSRSFGS